MLILLDDQDGGIGFVESDRMPLLTPRDLNDVGVKASRAVVNPSDRGAELALCTAMGCELCGPRLASAELDKAARVSAGPH